MWTVPLPLWPLSPTTDTEMIRKFALLATMAAFFVACSGGAQENMEKKADETMEKAGDMMDKAADDMKEAAGNAMDTVKAMADSAGAAMDNAMDKAKEGVENAADAAKQAVGH